MANNVYVHALVPPFHPNNRYRVVDSGTVAELGWSASSGMWGLAEADRQVCHEPIGEPCGCVVEQRPTISVDVAELKEGDVIQDAADLGPVRFIREVSVDYGGPELGVGYRVYGTRNNDLFAAPQRVQVTRT